MRLRLALLSTFLLSVPATPMQATATDGTPSPAVRAPSPVHPRGRAVLPAPGPSSKSAAPHPRPSLTAAVARATIRVGNRLGEVGAPATAATTHTPADAIGWCESHNRYDAENPQSSASGRWQFLDSTWRWVTGLEPPASAWPPSVQRGAFLTLWDDGAGASHWEPSASCWQPLLEGAKP